ncbi:MarR family winged helix-turn-helix transcriptional regulator [Pendulispora albinea]|uniref:MarR family transcriptional regulator n=1 Tax=Pendulispora albinea TaxID=2741071 RepID=A0ABZ2M157_9BACT
MPKAVTLAEYRALAEIRYRIRRFINFSEASARAVGLEPQQHQLLLAIHGLPPEEFPTIGRIAERLQIQHHSAVELVNRSAENGLVKKRPSERDRREVLLEVTPRGRRLLEKLAVAHRTELRSVAPTLLETLAALVTGEGPALEDDDPELERDDDPENDASDEQAKPAKPDKPDKEFER